MEFVECIDQRDGDMLIRLTPEQISDHWEQLEFAIKESLPPTIGEVPDKMNNILMSLLDSRMQAWTSCSVKDGKAVISGFVITQVLDDLASKTKSLLIYCLYGYEDVDESEWVEGIRVLKKFRDSIGCRRILAYTDMPYIIDVAKRLGANTDYTLVYWE